MLKGNIFRKIEEEKEIRSSLSGGNPMHPMRESISTANGMPPTASPVRAVDGQPDRSTTSPVPIPDASPSDRSSNVEQRGSFVLPSSFKRGDGIFSRMAQANSDASGSPAGAGVISLSDLERR